MSCTVTIKHSGTETKYINTLVSINFYDATYYDMSDKNVVNLGLKTKFSLKILLIIKPKMKSPFYSHLITLTNHYPLTLDEKDATIEKSNTGDATVDGYIQTARYLDEALEEIY